MANWSNPTLTSLYTDFLTQLKDRDTDLALQFDGVTTSNLTTGTIRWNSTVNRWQKWNGSSWAELTTTYALTGLSTTGNASIGGTLTVTGATSLSGGGTSTTVATADNSTAIATTAFVKAQGYALLASPAFTGTPTAPTAALGTNTTQLATTAYVNAEIANDAPTKTGGGASGTWGISISGNAATVSNGAYVNAAQTFSQRQYFYSASGTQTHNVWSSAIEIREVGIVGNTQTTNNYAPAINFHWSNVAATAVKMFSDASVRVIAQDNTGSPVSYRDFYAGAFYSSGSVVLHAGNFNSYAPTLTGTGASGTWNISISGGTVSATTGSFSGDVTMSGTGQLKLAAGTTAQRSGTPSAGMIRYNTTLGQFEGYNGSAWGQIGGGATGAGGDAVFLENGQAVTANYTLTSGKNAVSAGPITINSGIVVTVPSGANWSIV